MNYIGLWDIQVICKCYEVIMYAGALWDGIVHEQWVEMASVDMPKRWYMYKGICTMYKVNEYRADSTSMIAQRFMLCLFCWCDSSSCLDCVFGAIRIYDVVIYCWCYHGMTCDVIGEMFWKMLEAYAMTCSNDMDLFCVNVNNDYWAL